MAASDSHVTIEAGSVLALGVWCDACALPSAVTVELVALTSYGVRQLGPVTGCGNCRSILATKGT